MLFNKRKYPLSNGYLSLTAKEKKHVENISKKVEQMFEFEQLDINLDQINPTIYFSSNRKGENRNEIIAKFVFGRWIIYKSTRPMNFSSKISALIYLYKQYKQRLRDDEIAYKIADVIFR